MPKFDEAVIETPGKKPQGATVVTQFTEIENTGIQLQMSDGVRYGCDAGSGLYLIEKDSTKRVLISPAEFFEHLCESVWMGLSLTLVGNEETEV